MYAAKLPPKREIFVCFWVKMFESVRKPRFFAYFCGMKKLTFLLFVLLLSVACHAVGIITVSKIAPRDGLPVGDVKRISCDSTGFLYFAFPHATYRYDGYDFIRMPMSFAGGHGKNGMEKHGLDNRGNSYRLLPDGKFEWTDHTTGETAGFNVLEKIMRGYADSVRLSVVDDGRGVLWVSVYGNGLFVFDRRQRHLRHFHQGGSDGIIDSDLISCMAMDGNGNVWVAQEGFGVACLRVVPQRMMRLPSSGGSRARMLRDNKGRVWSCRGRGVALATPAADGKYAERHFLDALVNPKAIVQDHNGNVWVGGDGGLCRFKPERLLANGEDYSRISGKAVRSLFLDSSNRIWIAMADGGVVYGPATSLDGGRMRRLTKASGLPANGVWAVAEDRQGQMYIVTDGGCAVYNPSTGRIFRFDCGKRHAYGSGSGAALLGNGDMAIASDEGVCVIALHSHGHGGDRLVLSDLQVDGVSVYDMDGDVAGKKDVAINKEIRLAHSQNSLVFKFSALDYGGSRRMEYSYMLEGCDVRWSAASALNFASYKNLPPGTYRLAVRCRDGGRWTPARTLLTLTISPPWWASWWAMTLYAVVAIAVAAIVYGQVRRVVRLRQRVVLERQTTDFRIGFFTDISHEFRTPLTLIQASVDNIKSSGSIPGGMKGAVGSLERSTGRMMRLVNQLMEFRRMQTGKLALALQETDLVPFLYNIWMNFHDEAENRKIGYQFLPQRKSAVAYVDRGHVDKIVYNLLSNAFKYTPAQGSIQLSLRVGDVIEIVVSDTGVGISPDCEADLFKRYATGRMSADGMGIGLNLSFELAKTHHGSIAYSRHAGGGSVFTLTLPAGKDAYQPDDFMLHSAISIGEELVEKEEGRQAYRENLPEPLNDRRVLVVEDDDDLRGVLVHELAKYFAVGTAADGEEAMRELGAQSYDIVVTDVVMPGMDGWSLLRGIRKDARLRTMPVIMLTALADDAQRVRALDDGADAYIAKPFHVSVLVAQCANLLERHDALACGEAGQAGTVARAYKGRDVIRVEWEKRFVERLDIYISDHIADPAIDIDALAEMFSMGRTTFFRTVKRLTGKSPGDYLKGRRLYKAAECLREEDCTVAEAAYKAGFANVQYFSTIFKKRFGVTPREYQKGR